MATAAFGRIICLELRPDLLRQLQAVGFILGGRAELAHEVAPHLRACLNVHQQPRKKRRRHMAVGTGRPNAELIRIMSALRQFLEGDVHLVTRRAEGHGFGQFQSADETAGNGDADEEGNEAPGRYAEQEPALRAPPQPGTYTCARRRRGIHFEPVDEPITILRVKPASRILARRLASEKNTTRSAASFSVRFRTEITEALG